MASSDNVTNEKSSDFDDGAYDPDLEARLYAEIYYSAETYVPDSEETVPERTEAPNVSTSLSSSKSFVPNGSTADARPVPLNKENHSASNYFVEDFGADNDVAVRLNSDTGKPYYTSKSWVFGERSVTSKVAKTQRPLAYKGLWSTSDNTKVNGSACRQPNATPIRTSAPAGDDSSDALIRAQLSTEQGSLSAERASLSTERGNLSTERRSLGTERGNLSTERGSSGTERESNTAHKISRTRDVTLSAKKRKLSKQKQKNLKQRLRQRARSKETIRNDDALNNAGVTMETSKYNVVSKKKKLKMKQINPEPVDISSDSDDSILEVPVPPKAPPVIIQLPDSDDDCEKSSGVRSTKTKKSIIERNDKSVTCCNLETDSSMSDESLELPTRESSQSNFDEVSNEVRNNVGNTSTVLVGSTCPEDNTLILNCTEIQRGASSLDEIRKMRETVPSFNTHSDDSMTESEANNWVNIAAGQLDVTRDEEICSIERSNDTVNTVLWDQLSQENSTVAGLPTEIPSTSDVASSVERAVVITEEDANASIVNEEVTSTRKRHKDVESVPFTDFHVPAIPEKRTKRNTDKSSREQSLSEYFFKPMSKQLQAFYDNPWGGENMNLYDIQSRMTKNPKCWAILDADLHGPTSKRRRTCPRCKTDSHFGKRCPEKAKAPCCYMCGAKGHTESRCPHTMCLTCGRKYATYRPTCGYCSQLYCNMCNGTGHGSENCPDLWRRYHNTTTEMIPVAPREALNVMKAPQLLTCCNCAKRGHDVTMCRQLRWSQHFLTPMYVSSYTKGPFYESTNNLERMPGTIPSDNHIYESVHREQIDGLNSGANPIYVPSHHEQIHDTTLPDDCNEILEGDDDHGRDAPTVEASNSISTSTVIFQCGDFVLADIMTWHSISKRLDTIENVHLVGLLSGQLSPTFLHTWQKFFEFAVRLSRDSDNVTYMLIKAESVALVQDLDKLIMQWLTRNDDEKPYLEYDILPYDDIDNMMKTLRDKTACLSRVLAPTELFQKIVRIENALKQMSVNLYKTASIKKSRRRHSVVNKQINVLTKRRNQLVTSLYSRSWVKGAVELVRSFRQLVRKIKDTKKQLPIRHYLKLMYLNNIIFTFHTSAELSEALDKAIQQSRLLESASTPVAELPPVDTSSVWGLTGSRTEPIENIDLGGISSAEIVPNVPMIDKNSLTAYCSPLASGKITIIEDRGEKSSQIPTISGTADARNAISSGTNYGTDVDFHKEWTAPFKPVSVEIINLQNAVLTPKINGRRIIERSSLKNTDRSQGLVRNLTKRNRKLYKSSAREVIKLANSSNLTHLHEMAKMLKLKMGNGSISTHDVHTLQEAVETTMGQKISTIPKSQRPRPSVRNNYNKAYQDFLRTL